MSSKNNQRIQRPDVAVRDKKLDTLNVQLKKVDQEISLLRKQIDQYQISDNKKNERKALLDENKEIIKNQADIKNRRNNIHDSIKQLDAQIKRRNNEISDKLGKKNQFASVAAAKQRINEIEDIIGGGDLSIVQEKLMVKEMQQLNKVMKDLQLIDPIKKAIEADKAKIVELKEQLSSANARELSNKFEENQKKLDDLQNNNQSLYDKRQTLLNKRTALYNKRDEIYAQIRNIRADFDNEFKAFRSKLEKDRLKREQDQLLFKLIEEKDAAIGKIEEKLIHAKIPAYTYEIGAIQNSLLFLDPTYVRPKKNDISNISDDKSLNEVTTIKKVEANDLVLVAVDENKDSFHGTAPSKSKKFKKRQQKTEQQKTITEVDGKFLLDPTLIATLSELDVTVPISKDDIPKTVEDLKTKLEDYSSKQDEQTEKNVSAVEEELETIKAKYAAKEEEIKQKLEERRAKEQEQREQKEQAIEVAN